MIFYDECLNKFYISDRIAGKEYVEIDLYDGAHVILSEHAVHSAATCLAIDHKGFWMESWYYNVDVGFVAVIRSKRDG